mmetsp:Transcript_14010/g.23214  ORF Transcript_14010/g.23214 Transcript_14010/m.23214 type:complete len:113 (+) Transcript_14010:293-631(+)
MHGLVLNKLAEEADFWSLLDTFASLEILSPQKTPHMIHESSIHQRSLSREVQSTMNFFPSPLETFFCRIVLVWLSISNPSDLGLTEETFSPGKLLGGGPHTPSDVIRTSASK